MRKDLQLVGRLARMGRGGMPVDQCVEHGARPMAGLGTWDGEVCGSCAPLDDCREQEHAESVEQLPNVRLKKKVT